ncbi:ABC transporter substrate-binding protein [Streptomyces spinoverrucosus]|uniref:ABC transporter substrate-binding protein n=1 Tax=Streptomyces spinoverrucosus TaxID=284043 RepID=UPI0018C3C654|nr:ABC transporter substrate-binding protein [Streptomyces spinoverrucosus]MBG0855497.1 ABC transporter substrate-binding protein [Streptomyces spinoverrucosus]
MRLRERHRTSRRSRRPLRAALALLLLLLGAAGCGYGSRAPGVAAAPAVGTGPPLSAESVSVGYFANVTHATPLAAVQEGYFTRELGGTRLRTQVFNGGPSALEALNAGAVDIAWMGPSPAVNGFLRSDGRALRIVSGAASGGVALVVDADTKVRGTDIRGLRIATPEAGNTQDVALLHWVRQQGWAVDPHTGRGDVTVVRQSVKEIPTSFRRGAIDGAWVPEPVAAQLVAAGGRVLVDEADLWDGGAFVTALVVVNPAFLKDHPDVVEAVLRGAVRTNAWLRDRPAEGRAAVNRAIETLTGRPLPGPVLDAAWRHVRLTADPLAATLAEEADRADRLGLLGGSRDALDGIFDLRPLNRVLAQRGEQTVADAGLGVAADESH